MSTSFAAPAAGHSHHALTWRLLAALGLSQLIAWGTLHYLIAVFAAAIAAEMHWSSARVQTGFALAMLVMAASSYTVGRWIDERGGRLPLMSGCWIGALGCTVLAAVDSYPVYLSAWVLIGLGMRLALYDAVFATLAGIAGTAAQRAISVVTIMGGLASTVFWPLGQHLLERFGWRGALLCYAGFLLACSLLHLAVPKVARRPAQAGPATGAVASHPPTQPAVAWLYTYCAVGVVFLQTGMAAHFIELLRHAGWSAGDAVWLATLFGAGQFCGRATIALWAFRFNPVALNLVPAVLLVVSIATYLGGGGLMAGATTFAFLYGLSNGSATYTRGAMPLVLFDPAKYGRTVGLMLKPALALSAVAPVAFGHGIDRWSAHGLATGILVLALSLLAASAALYRLAPRPAVT